MGCIFAKRVPYLMNDLQYTFSNCRHVTDARLCRSSQQMAVKGG